MNKLLRLKTFLVTEVVLLIISFFSALTYILIIGNSEMPGGRCYRGEFHPSSILPIECYDPYASVTSWIATLFLFLCLAYGLVFLIVLFARFIHKYNKKI